MQGRSFRIVRNEVYLYFGVWVPRFEHLKTLVPGDPGWYTH